MFPAFPRLSLSICLAAALGWLAAYAAPPASPTEDMPTIAYQIRTDRTGRVIDWIGGQLEVCARGFVLGKGEAAKRQARSTALTLLVNEARRGLAAVPVDSTMLLRAALQQDDVRPSAESIIAQIRIASERWDEKSGVYTIVGVLPLYGERGLSYLGAQSMASFAPLAMPESMITITNPIPRGHTTQRAAAPYTGIIVDGDKAMLTPCLLPRIVRFDGKELWGPFMLTLPDDLIIGPVHYAPNLEFALQAQLAGERPLIVTAVGHAQEYHPVLNVDDVYLLLNQQKQEAIFGSLPIIITLGRQE